MAGLSAVQTSQVRDAGVDGRQRSVAELDVDVRARRFCEPVGHGGELNRGLQDVRNLALALRVDDAVDGLHVRQCGDSLLQLPDARKRIRAGQISARDLDQNVERHELALGQVLAQGLESDPRFGPARQLFENVEVLLELRQRQQRCSQEDEYQTREQAGPVRDPPGQRRPEPLLFRIDRSGLLVARPEEPAPEDRQ